MMYMLKHYKGLLNLEKFSRIEKGNEEKYELIKQSKPGATKVVSALTLKPIIRFFTTEGYGGLSTVIEYETVEERDEDYDIIVSIICQNKSQNFDILNEQQNIAENYSKLNDQAKELRATVESINKFISKNKIKIS